MRVLRIITNCFLVFTILIIKRSYAQGDYVFRPFQVGQQTGSLVCLNGNVTGALRWTKMNEIGGSGEILTQIDNRIIISESPPRIVFMSVIESDEGYYIVQGDGGHECKFNVFVYGLFSFTQGELNGGNWEETVDGTEGCGILLSCEYIITGISNATKEAEISVHLIGNNIVLSECDNYQYPFCDNCVGCMPTTHNPFMEFIIIPSPSMTLQIRCNANLGPKYNGLSFSKLITIRINPQTTTNVTQSYKANYTVCENISIEANYTRILSSDYNVIQAGSVYSSTDLQYIQLEQAGEIGCQGYDALMWPIREQCALYDIQLKDIPNLPNDVTSRTYTVEECGAIIIDTFNCSYELVGGTTEDNTDQLQLMWEIDNSMCSAAELCNTLGSYSQVLEVNISQLAIDTSNGSVPLMCSVTIDSITYYRKWDIDLTLMLCATTLSTTTTMDTTTTEIQTTMMDTTSSVTTSSSSSSSQNTQTETTSDMTINTFDSTNSVPATNATVIATMLSTLEIAITAVFVPLTLVLIVVLLAGVVSGLILTYRYSDSIFGKYSPLVKNTTEKQTPQQHPTSTDGSIVV